MSKEKMSDLFSICTRSELWATVAVILAAVYQANVLPDSWGRVASLALAVLAALGYGTARTIKKMGDAKADALVEASRTMGPVNP